MHDVTGMAAASTPLLPAHKSDVVDEGGDCDVSALQSEFRAIQRQFKHEQEARRLEQEQHGRAMRRAEAEMAELHGQLDELRAQDA